MTLPLLASNQISAVIRRYFIVMDYYDVMSIIRVIIWPGLILLPIIFSGKLASKSDGLFLADYVHYLIIFMTLPHVYSFVNYQVSDKASGMKSLMMSMGLSRINYYAAISLCFNSLVLPIIWIFMLSFMSTFLVELDALNFLKIFGLSILFTLHLDAYIAFCVSFITSPSFSFVVPSILLAEEPFLEPLARFLNKSFGQESALFFLSHSPYQIMRGFFSNFSIAVMMGPTPSPMLITAAQIFWTISFRLFAYWFEEICPWQKASTIQPFCFCLNRRRGRVSEGDSLHETPSSTSKYFEQRSNDGHEVGIRINHVTKTYSKRFAVNDVSFNIYRGETTLLLGHNGAGKSTLMNIILGLLEPDHGQVKVKNRPGRSSTAIGVCPQTSILDNDLTVKQHLEFFNDIKSTMTSSERGQHIFQTMTDVSLECHSSKRPSELSGGMKRKLSLGIAFVGKSDVLILDEPSSGLDPDSRMFVWNAIRRYRSHRTVLLSTQHMEEADYLGDRIAIMSSGRIVCCGSSVYLNKLFGTGYKLRIECRLSKRKQILEHIGKNYFDAIQPVEMSTNLPKHTNGDPIVDLVLELKTNDKNKDPELELIRLLEDFENNAESLSIRSYGLKSSSIEDVMLNTSKYFASLDLKEGSQLEQATNGHISALTSVKTEPNVKCRTVMWALICKHMQVHYANWPTVLLLRVVLPILGIYRVSRNLKEGGAIFFDKPDRDFPHDPSLALIVAHLIYYPVRERTTKFKIMQLTSSTSIWIYWAAQFVFDLLWLIFPIISVIIFTANYATKLNVPHFQFYGLIVRAIVLFYLASQAFCYCLSNVISNSRSAVGYFFIITMVSVAVSFVTFFIRVLLFSKKNIIHGVWIQDLIIQIGVFIFPTDALSYFYHGISTRCYLSGYYNCRNDHTFFSPESEGLFALSVQVVAYSLLLVYTESQSIDIEWIFRSRNVSSSSFRDSKSSGGNRWVDLDVDEETTKASAAIKEANSPHALVASQLNKSYIEFNKIIDNLSFTVNRGECFGLLGVNGAGKTTTFAMLATETAPDSGRILADGYYNDESLHSYRRKIGYDPQATPELSLSPYQALYLMARLRGIDEVNIPRAVDSILHLLEMTEHTHKNDAQLSGGTKRKLALGMALIGTPAILTLDEPTAGVDPLARRSIWQLLKSLRTSNDSAIIISSHAMEECEAICDRITIMARGRLRCIGTFLNLRSKFAKGCTLRVQFGEKSISTAESASAPSTVDTNKRGSNDQTNSTGPRSCSSILLDTDQLFYKLQHQLVTTIGFKFERAVRNVNSVKFSITDNEVRKSILFRMMRDFCQAHPTVDYIINDPSLEDIFISLTREQQELERGDFFI